jgi:hypothetical protein
MVVGRNPRGRIVNLMGDGILAKFGSVVEPAAEIFDTEDVTYA